MWCYEMAEMWWPLWIAVAVGAAAVVASLLVGAYMLLRDLGGR
jgi:hypothetical protein